MLFRSDRKSTRLNSSHTLISYAVFCLKKKKNSIHQHSNTPTKAAASTPVARLPTLVRFCPPPAAASRLSSPRSLFFFFFFFFNDTGPTEIYPLSLHDALPI